MKLSFWLTHYSNPSITAQCLSSILANEEREFQILLINNSQDPQEALALQKALQDLNPSWVQQGGSLRFERSLYLHQAPSNLGYGGGMNLAAELAKGNPPDFVILLNNDTLVPEDFLKRFLPILQTRAQEPDFGMLGCLIREYPDTEKIWFASGHANRVKCMGEHLYDLDPDAESLSASFLTGCFWAFIPQTYWELGGMREEYFLYFEDLEFCYRLQERNKKLYVTHLAEIYHQVGSSTGGEESTQVLFLSTRNRLWIAKEHGPYLRFLLFYLPSRLLKIMGALVGFRLDRASAIFKGVMVGLMGHDKNHPQNP